MADSPLAYCIPRESAREAWPGVAKMVEQAYNFADEIMPPDMVDLLSAGYLQLWVVWNGEAVIAAVVTRIDQHKSCRACHIVACGGDQVESWKHLIAVIEDFAKREGCRKVIIEGRPGWERLFRDYKRIRVVIEREI